MRILLVLFCLAFSWTSAYAERAEFTLLKTVKVAELNRILSQERTEFLDGVTQGPNYVLPSPSTASNDVDLYTVRYYSTIPELGGKEIRASGLLAVPANAGRSGKAKIPLIAYLHGTVFGKYEVPSYAFRQKNPSGEPHYMNAYEGRYMVALFAGNGYAVMAPDYFGMGGSAGSNEAYMMKRSTAQGNYDLYLDSVEFLRGKNIVPSKFLVSGWSQGGLNTTGFLELLEEKGVDVRAAFTAASPNDPYAMVNAILFHPRAADARWVPAILGLTTFACEKYLGPKGLAKEVIDPEYYSVMKSIYDRTYGGPAQLYAILVGWAQVPFEDFLRPAYRNPAAFAGTAFSECLSASETYRQEFTMPLRMYYGSVDEVIRPMIGLLGNDYQKRITDTPDAPSSSNIKAFRVEDAGHRLTFISASVDAKRWMDGMH